MPNNRNRNRNRNRNKRNKNQNANQNKQQAAAAEGAATEEREQQEEATAAAATTSSSLTAANDHQHDNNANSGSISNGSTTASDSLTAADESTTRIASREDSQKEPEEQSEVQQEDQSRDQSKEQHIAAKDHSSKDQAEEKLVDQLEDQPTVQTKEKLLQHSEDQHKYQSEDQLEDLCELQAEEKLKDQPTVQTKEKLLQHLEDQHKHQSEDQLENLSEDQTTEKPIDQPVDQTKEKLVKQLEDLPAVQSGVSDDQTKGKLIDQLEDQTEEKPVKQPQYQSTDQLADLSEDQTKEKAIDQPVDQTKVEIVQQLKDQPGCQSEEQLEDPSKHLTKEKLVEYTEEQSIAQAESQPEDQSENQPQELPRQQSEEPRIEQLVKKDLVEDPIIEKIIDQLDEQAIDQPREHLIEIHSEAQTKDLKGDLNRAKKPSDQPVYQSEDQLKKQAVVHIVPVIVEKENKHEAVIQTQSDAMGAKNSKQQREQLQQETELSQEQQQLQAAKPPGSPRQAKVIVHRIVRESNDEVDAHQQQQEQQQAQQQQQETQTEKHLPAAVQELLANCQLQQPLAQQQHIDTQQQQVNAQQQQLRSPQHATKQPLQRSTKVIIHQIRLETDEEERARKGKPTIEEISSTTATTTAHSTNSSSSNNNSGTLSPPPRYLVESPSPKAVQQFSKFARDVQIQELELSSDCSSGEFNGPLQSPVVFEADSETEASTPTATIAPVAVLASSADLPSSSRAEQQEQLRQKRAQKRNALESHFLPQLLSPRYLDSILEENSEAAAAGGDASLSRSASASSSGNDPAKTRSPLPAKANEAFPRSQLDFSRRHKRREEPLALMLETKLLEQPSDLESCTRLQSTLSPQSEDAELVYLSSSGSSSVSDLMELELEEAAALAKRALSDLDTDASRLINRPDDDLSSTTTTEPISSSNETETEGECEVETEVDTETEATTAADQSSRESTPVNAHPPTEPTSPGSSSLSSLLSAATLTPTATPTPALNELPREANQHSTLLANEFSPNKLANSSTATTSLAATREEFVRNMEKVRELIEMTRREIGNVNGNGNVNENAPAAPEQQRQQPNELRCRLSPTPPPVPPPPSSMHYPATSTAQHPILNPLLLKRQESNDSHCSDSTQHSQCTAIHVASPTPQQQPPTPPLRQQQQQQQPAISPISAAETEAECIKKLRLLCTETLASMPYGEQMLEELASVAQNITEQQQQQQQQQQVDNMPYPMPQLPHIGELQLSLDQAAGEKDAWLGLPTQKDPQLLVCLSPAQRALTQQQQLQPAADQLLDAHEKFVQRRGYHELSAEQVRAMDSAQMNAEQEQILKTAAKMRELRKSLTPTATTPPPPPVPVKSAETAAKAKSQAAQQQQQQADDVSQKANSAATMPATSSFENKPTAAAAADPQLPYAFDQRTVEQQQQSKHSSNSNSSYMSHSSNIKSSSNNSSSKFPASMESELARMFPSMAQQGDIFDEQRKRFSNIEQSGQPKPQHSKRYSNIETSSFESKKRVENGQVIYDYSNSSREQQQQQEPAGDTPTANGKFPVREVQQQVPQVHQIPVRQAAADEVDCAPPVPPPPAAANMMSATKLNGMSNTFNDDAQQQQLLPESRQHREQTTTTTTTTGAKVNSSSSSGTYEEFRQRAKAALDAIAQPNGNGNGQPSTGNHLDNEKLFKDFDVLSQQLNAELQTGREQRQQRDKSASLYDLSRLTNSNNNNSCQLEQLKRERHAHMQELEREIERSARSRQERLSSVPRAVEIPIQLAPDYERARRAESLCNLNEPARPHSSAEHYRVPTEAMQQDDWAHYASDLGYSENIARPFAREVEICYQRQNQRQPHSIRAPRLSASTNDLSSSSCYDSFNAYGGGRRHAPMLQQAPQQQRPHYASCYSMIERDPNPTYISTTSRRGVSPAPVSTPVTPQPGQPPAYDRQRERRASLPRELHEQQLKYILSKEEQLKLEFERLQQERRRLMEEMQRAPTVLQAPPPRRESYRPAPKLPTLSEDEVFRQQMAEEWMNKVAEREERRQHKIIKISKIEDEQQHATEQQANISDEFLNRVKERRHKLSMPADSDWESGAESQPAPAKAAAAAGSESDAEAPTPVRILEGQAEANLRELPRHLREFAKFSSCEQLKGDAQSSGQVERHEQQERSETATDNSLSSASKKSTIVKTYKVSRLPPSVQARPSYKSNGYVSEPEPNYDSDYSTVKYRTPNPLRVQSVSSAVNVRNLNQDDKLYGTMPNPIKAAQNSYKNQPGRIENYTTGHSSVSEKEKKEWWDEVMDIFNGNLEQSKLSPLYTEGNLSRALAKESGYTSDSNLVFRKKELPVSSPLSPVEQRQAYKSLQAGGEPPLLGFRKPAPEKPKDVNIHFKTPIRHEYKQNISEEELAIRQAEHMQKLYQEERRRKYLQELQDMNSRRHTDNFTPSQKSPIALNRYDDFPTDVTLKSLVGPKTVARALYNFQGQTSKELSFRKGDTIYIRRQIDPNWYEGEHNAMIGLLPASYVEIVSRDGARTPGKRPSEGQARAKYNFQAQSGVELSLNKGELVTLTRRVDGNWFEGKIANRKGIFPVSYVEVLTDIGAEDIAARTTTVINTQSTTNLRPNLDVLRTNINNEFNTLTQNGAHPPNGILKETRTLHKTDALHVDTSSEPLTYRALYKYRPQNSDELEIFEGDLVQVLEKCDDGWFVGTSQRTGCFGTFPGNYVERA
ncbi:uncharacterized protein LOC115760414 isoform X4 [Drosophila novamexicana]|uniref:uncharacterized protein LOC115760414 isoform X4 n=1 Tax=Drosophila novamexicana TaxID=47314 RepID=UPI0011E58A79|nr:uncharacterized protein LOC115760414 isoform X4 [Drosophila novamexicana]